MLGTAGHISPLGLSFSKRPDWVPHMAVSGFPEGENGNRKGCCDLGSEIPHQQVYLIWLVKVSHEAWKWFQQLKCYERQTQLRQRIGKKVGSLLAQLVEEDLPRSWLWTKTWRMRKKQGRGITDKGYRQSKGEKAMCVGLEAAWFLGRPRAWRIKWSHPSEAPKSHTWHIVGLNLCSLLFWYKMQSRNVFNSRLSLDRNLLSWSFTVHVSDSGKNRCFHGGRY